MAALQKKKSKDSGDLICYIELEKFLCSHLYVSICHDVGIVVFVVIL